MSAESSRGCPTEALTTSSIVCTFVTGRPGSIDATIWRAARMTFDASSPVVRTTTDIDAKGCCSIVRYISKGVRAARPYERTSPMTPMTCHQLLLVPGARRLPRGSCPGQNLSAIALLITTTCADPWRSRRSNSRPFSSGMPIVLK